MFGIQDILLADWQHGLTYFLGLLFAISFLALGDLE